MEIVDDNDCWCGMTWDEHRAEAFGVKSEEGVGVPPEFDSEGGGVLAGIRNDSPGVVTGISNQGGVVAGNCWWCENQGQDQCPEHDVIINNLPQEPVPNVEAIFARGFQAGLMEGLDRRRKMKQKHKKRREALLDTISGLCEENSQLMNEVWRLQ